MKWKLFVIPFILFVLSRPALATHIVGGEIEMVHDTAYVYRINLILYFDSVNGNPGAEDQFVTIGVFRKFDNVLIDTITLPKTTVSNVPYSFPDCSIPELVTKRITYSGTRTFSPQNYNDINGYYMSWDRCCRNNNISNLILPGEQGQNFYLEFPSVIRGGTQFINSSPVLFPPVSDYACRNELFYFDFSGTDTDGDSLVYTMSEPLRGFSSSNFPLFPIPQPGPYPSVIWQTGIGLNNMIPGNPPLQISNDGFLTVKPLNTGLFVFAVKCEEYRNNVKIGEARRDFQIIVRDCPSNEKPAISVQNPVDSSSYFESDTLYFDLNNRCFNIFMSDPDPNTKINVKINALNFDPDLVSISPKNGLLPSSSDSIKATICFNKCANSDSGIYQFEIILSDDGCSLPKQDTFLITAIVEAIPDLAPTISSNYIGDSLIHEVGDTIFFSITGFDSDNDTIVLAYGNNTFSPSSYGMIFSTIIDRGQVIREFFWIPDCRALNLNGEDLVFRVYDFLCSDYYNELRYPIKISSDNIKPILTSDLTEEEITVNLRDGLNFNLFATDSNSNDILILKPTFYTSSGIALNNLDYSLSQISSTAYLESNFIWNPGCEFLEFEDLLFVFEIRDNGCNRAYDSLIFPVKFIYENTAPELTIKGEIPNGKKTYDVKIFTDSISVLEFEGIDLDLDFLEMHLDWVNDNDSLVLPVDFEVENGQGSSAGSLTIGPGTCTDFDAFKTELMIILRERSCENERDTILLNIEVEEFFKEIKIPNVFTPNGDGYNDLFYAEQLPKKCRFAEIIIYNRWGRQVFQSDESNFYWDAKEIPAGDYFYYIRFEESNYKGVVKVMK